MRRRLIFLLALIALPLASAAAELHRHTIATDGGAIEYLDWGSGPSIVMIASLGRGAEDFGEIASGLADRGFRVIAPQPRGIGQSTSSSNPMTLHDYAADVAAVIEQTGTGPAVVLGHAYGNTVARTLAADRPDLVSGVILVAASGRSPLDKEVRMAIAKASDLSVPAAQRLHSLEVAYFAKGNDAKVWLDGWYPDLQKRQWKAFNTSKPDEYIAAGGRVPILDIQGEEDAVIPGKYSQDLRHELGERVSVVVIPHAGHALIPEQPTAVINAITDWLRLLQRSSRP
ncbi:MAG: alpha/beta hydrolase [Paraburkholderia sp.]|nr:MAG: alpha/beta hydrolase [Paraburkholderia sp.]